MYIIPVKNAIIICYCVEPGEVSAEIFWRFKGQRVFFLEVLKQQYVTTYFNLSHM